MELKRGYKQTEVGIIPEDWEVKALFEILKFGSGKDYKHLSSGEIPVYGTGGLMTFVDHFLYQGDSVGIGRKGTIDKPVFLSGKFWTVDTLFYTHTFSGVLPKFIYYKFLLVKWKEFNEASGVPSLNKNTLDKIKISVPNISEQTAIANALSDMDALIAQTERLIEKKKAIKQGVMQELLQPKEDWVTKKLGDYGRTYGGITGKTKSDFGKGSARYIPFMNIMSNPIIDVHYLDTVDIKPNEVQNKALKDDLFFNGSSETPEEVGLCSVLFKDIEDLYLNSFCFGYRTFSKDELNGLFVSYLFRSSLGRSLIFSLAQGATRYNLSKTNLLKLELPIPPKEEQDKIAMVLWEIDLAIETLNNKLQKLKLQKQGMMQALLTGKTRLI
jgi:type I restriction enzyme S subunit